MNIWFQVFISLLAIAPASVAFSYEMESIESEPSQPLEHSQIEDSMMSTPEEGALDFSCQLNQGVPVTVAETSEMTIPIIHWASQTIAVETTPANDCEASIDRFQSVYDDGLFSYITTGRMDGQLVVCTADTINGGCISRLLDLQPTPKPRLALQSVLQISLPTEGPISDTDCRAYVNLERYLQGDYGDQADICPPEAILPNAPL